MPKNLPKKILITGASGMLGLNLCRMLRQERYEVVGAYNSNPELLNVDVEKLQLDITSKEMVMKVAKKHPIIDVIIHCAAMTNPDQCEKDKKLCSLVNVVGTKNIVDLAKNLGAKLIFISTPMVFSGNEGNYNEKSIPEPLNYYAKTKLEGEKEVLKYDKGLVVRVNPIGLRASGAYPSFIQWFVEAARTNKDRKSVV